MRNESSQTRAPEYFRCVRVGNGRSGLHKTSDGFTLVELLITVTIIPLVMGAIGLALMGIFSLQGSASGRLTDSGAAQVISSTFLKDVQSASWLTTGSAAQCGSGTQLLALAWDGSGNPNGSDNYQTIVSYVTAPNSGGSSYSMFRQFCSSGPSTTPTSTDTLATDLSPSTAITPPNVQCTAVAVACPSSGWIRAIDVSNVTINATETLSHLVNSTQSFTFTLSASPRQIPAQGATSAPAGKAPFTLLNKTSCDVLNIGNGTLSIDVGGTIGNGALGIVSTCPHTINIANQGVLAAGSIITSDPTLDSVNPGCQTCSYPLHEYYGNKLGDPFASVPPPTGVESGMTTAGTCQTTTGTQGQIYNCSPGFYATDPGQTVFANGGTPTVNFTPGGNFWFKQGLTLPNNAIATFATGVYIFDNLANPVTGSSFSTPPGITLHANNALFYVATGSMTFGNNISISMTGLDGTAGTSDYMGVTIWDASATDINNPDGSITHIDPLTLGNNGTSGYGYGGIYVPTGEVIDSENGTLTAAFIVCGSASFANGLNVNIKAQ